MHGTCSLSCDLHEKIRYNPFRLNSVCVFTETKDKMGNGTTGTTEKTRSLSNYNPVNTTSHGILEIQTGKLFFGRAKHFQHHTLQCFFTVDFLKNFFISIKVNNFVRKMFCVVKYFYNRCTLALNVSVECVNVRIL